MKEIIKDLRTKLERSYFEKEEHVRIGIVARIFLALGWDIWNPQEFYTEFSIKMKGRDGSVDAALFHSSLKDRTPDVFIEIKAVGKLKGNIESSEEQLQEYNYYNTASITLLTDGVIWRFYLTTAKGTFAQKLFCSLNLMEDDEDFIVRVFHDILARSRFSRDAVVCAEQMLSDLKNSREIERAKKEANQKSDDHPDLNKFQLVQMVLKERGRKFDLEEIRRLWDFKSVPQTEVEAAKEHAAPASEGVYAPEMGSVEKRIGGLEDDFTFSKVSRFFIVDQWYEVSYWWEVKKVIYNRFYDDLKNLGTLPKRMRIVENKNEFRAPITLEKGGFADAHGNANRHMQDMSRLLKLLGFNPETDLKIEYIPGYRNRGGTP